MKKSHLEKILLSIVLVLSVSPLAHAAKTLRAPNVPDGEVRKYQVRREGGKPYGIRSWVRPTEELKSYSVKSTWKPAARGRELVIHRDEVRMQDHRSIWNFGFSVIDNHMSSEWYDFKLISPEGKLLRSEKSMLYLPKPKEGTKKARKVAEDDTFITHPVVMSELLRSHKFKKDTVVYLRLWFPDIYQGPRMIFEVQDTESVTVPAGTFRAWRVNMRLDAAEFLGRFKGLEFLIKQLLPAYTMWYADIRTHPLIKFEGQFGPRNTAPMQIQEMISMEVIQ